MRKFETRLLSEEGFQTIQNWRWFAGHPFRVKKLAPGVYEVRALRWMWSTIAFTEEDYAYGRRKILALRDEEEVTK